jgi:hypothetical protein
VKTQDSTERHDVLVEKLHLAIQNGDISVVGAFADLVRASVASNTDGNGPHDVLNADELRRELRATLRFFFDRYDTSKDGFIDER